IIDTNEMYESVKNKSFDSLPKWISDTAAYAYELLTSTMDGQLFDMMIDKASLAKMIEFSKKSNSNFAIAITDTFVSLTNIKIALRLSESNKSDSVYDYAFCECDGIDVNLLKKASQKGKDEVVSYIEGTNYAKFSEYINKSYALFEKKCDNAILEMADSAKLISFGIEPLVAYYFAKEAECKTLKIIMNGKHIGLSKDEINERVRELYV
ncbi:MAG: V-type ATPase subunit, partial [Clostridia bacterium]|nr:V-type ATPase subunit [Clostridia bacterium]